MKLWMNGKLVDRGEARVDVYDHGLLYGDGVFEGIRVYGGKIFQAQAHVDRLFDSAKKIRLAIPYTKQEIIDAMYATLQANRQVDSYIRLVVTRGIGTLGLNPFNCATPAVFIISDLIALYPPEMYAEGMAVIIAKTVRTSRTMVDPSVKSLNYLNNILAKIEAIDAGVGEAFMLNADGEIAEATGDNIFLVKGGTIFTPPAEAGLLVGITRGVVLRLAAELKFPVKEKRLKPAELFTADECFMTGTAAEVIAVTSVDTKPIGAGRVGPVTQAMMKKFHEFVRQEQSAG